MTRRTLLIFLLPLLSLAFQTTLPVDDTWAHHQQCIDMHGSSERFHPQSASSILVTFNSHSAKGIASIVIFELADEHLGGKRRPGSNEKEIICTPENIKRQLCEPSQLGEFLISDHALQKAAHPMITRAVDLSKPIAILYPVTGPGYYCVAAVAYSAPSFSATMAVVDAGSRLPAFRSGLLGLYQTIAPVWMLASLSWVFFTAESTSWSLSLDHPAPWILLCSAGTTGARWAWLELGDDTAWGVLLRLSWYGLALAQNCIVLFTVHMMAARGSSRCRTRLIPAFLALFITLYVGAIWADSIVYVRVCLLLLNEMPNSW
ncbi:hypothetical protein QBC34DRAFT_432720 [Podospora aff. communis PSN243]|uniref:PTM1-like N-terminal domain-containing protein n=1 Tax=Podospora aff. communis PSN243 TaxID=3040156 RepID=A0AAV9H3Z4_9PEZI|nr:hypothetical protein QBC34DRAFT_432720 [Podospora aff. communis PSN243]